MTDSGRSFSKLNDLAYLVSEIGGLGQVEVFPDELPVRLDRAARPPVPGEVLRLDLHLSGNEVTYVIWEVTTIAREPASVSELLQ